jgi:glycosyltransferase involved in cell wall biosynthesis
MICTIPDRKKLLRRLLAVLQPQVDAAGEVVELLIDKDEGEVSIGAKRQRMLEKSRGRYLCYIDDDDLVHPRYVELILQALKSKPDCVGFRVKRLVDHREQMEAIHSFRFDEWNTDHTRPLERTPQHLNPIARRLAMKIGFRDMDHGEDHDYSTRLLPLLKSEVFIDRQLYEYDFLPGARRRHENTHLKKTGGRK